MIFSPRIITKYQPDRSSVARLLAWSEFQLPPGEALAIKLWDFLVDADTGMYHFWEPHERAGGHFTWDVLRLLNVYGFAVCGPCGNLLCSLYLAAGFEKVRVPTMPGHLLAEVYYDGAWHLFDPDLHAYHRCHPPQQDRIASHAECTADPTLISAQQNPSTPYYLADRAPGDMAKIYQTKPLSQPVYFPQLHTMDFCLRPGESIERYWHNEGKWIHFDSYHAAKKNYPKENVDVGPHQRFPPYRTFGNGRFVYAPDVTSSGCDVDVGHYAINSLKTTNKGLFLSSAGAGFVDFEFASPYAYAGIPDPEGGQPAQEGCVLCATLVRSAVADATRIQLRVAPEDSWETIWEKSGDGVDELRLDLTRYVENSYRYQLRFEFSSAEDCQVGLTHLHVTSALVLVPASLPALRRGANHLELRYGDEAEQLTKHVISEIDFSDASDVARKVLQTENFCHVPDTPERVRGADGGAYTLFLAAEAPAHGELVRCYVHGVFQHALAGETRTDRVSAGYSVDDGETWLPVFDAPMEYFREKWHFGVDGEVVFSEPVKSCLIRVRAKTGLKEIKVRAHYCDNRMAKNTQQIYITHQWKEAGELREHCEIIPPHETADYDIHCESEPENTGLLMCVPSSVVK